ncbi:MFS transporter [Streptomycetaceae bacterium NBC_01309]
MNRPSRTKHTARATARATAPATPLTGTEARDGAGAGAGPGAPRRTGPGSAVYRWLAAFGASLVGDQLWFMALSWQAVEASGPAAAGIVVTLGTVPRAILMLPGGSIADRFGARRVVIASDLVRCLVMVAAAVTVALTAPGIALLAVVALLFGAVDALFMPAVGAMPATLTTPDQYARVQGLRSLANRCAAVAGGPVSGLALAHGGVAGAFAASAVLFAVSLVLLWQLRPAARLVVDSAKVPDAANAPGGGTRERAEATEATEEATERATEEATERPTEATGSTDATEHAEDSGVRAGLRYAWSVPLLKYTLIVAIIAELGFSAPMNIGVVLLAADRGWGPGGLGLLIGAWGVGAVATGLILSVRGHVPRAGRVMVLGLVLSTVGIVATGVAPSLALAAAGAAVLGLGSGLWGGLCGALIQTTAVRPMLGRVVSVQMLGAIGLAPMTYPLAGLLSGAAGPASVFVAGAAVSTVGLVVAVTCRPLRRFELPRPGAGDSIGDSGGDSAADGAGD